MVVKEEMRRYLFMILGDGKEERIDTIARPICTLVVVR